jgi:cysteine-rich repeat protein
MTTRLALAVAVIALTTAAVACSRTVIDSHATGIEIATTIDADDHVTQLELSGLASGAEVFEPGLVPSVPRLLSGEQTADVLLSSTLDGTDMLMRVDALDGSAIVHTGGGMVTVRADALVHLGVTLGQPVICGDGVVDAPFETCDTGDTSGSDGCSATCQVDPGWMCTGMPSVCTPQTSNKEIMSFAFLAVANPGLSSDVLATINGTTITATVPFGTNVGDLVATFVTTGASIVVGSTPQVSGTTPNDFSSPVMYEVTATDGSKKTYTVTVQVASNSSNELTSFEFLAANNGALVVDIVGTINGTSIAATVPSGTSVTALVASFNTTGASVTVGGVAQVSGTTANNFSSPVMYTVTAANGKTKVYTVDVTVAPSSAKAITSFSFQTANNPSLTANVTATINGTTIAATVPHGTDVADLVATFATTGTSVAVNSVAQVSGTTANNFTNPVTYVVTAANGSTQMFTVTVTVALSAADSITSYAFLTTDNSGLSANVEATINGTTINATVPFNTDVTALVATFSSTGASTAVDGVAQTSGATKNDFTNPVQYTVTAANGSAQTYTVDVAIAKSTQKTITSFEFLSADNGTLGADVVATISGTTITATVPFGTDVTGLVATFATTGASVSVGGVAQTSGTTPNNFTNQVTYLVTAADSSTQPYTVTVSIAPSTERSITSYSFLSTNNPGLGVDVDATIDGTAISATVPFGTDVTNLIATFATTGASVAVGSAAQSSGQTANDFTNPVTYVVTAASGQTQNYTVTVTIAPSGADAITSFTFTALANSPNLSADVVATINGTSITATVPNGTNVTALVATFATSGASVNICGVVQTSGVTANDFTNSVTYTVVAANSSTQNYTVTVTVAASSADAITAYSFLSADNSALGSGSDAIGTIDGTAISVTVPTGTDVTGLVATFTTTGQSVSIGSTAQVSGITANDFTNPVAYTVTAADNSQQPYTVTVTFD